MAARIVSVLFILLLVVGVPVLSLSTARDNRLRQMRRIDVYVSAAISQWALAVVGVVVFSLGSLSALSVGFRWVATATAVMWAVGTLYPSMLAHGLIDAVALAWLGPKFLGRETRDQGLAIGEIREGNRD